MKKNKKKLNNKGFSLVELIIVIAIIAILAGALAPQLIKYLDKSRKASDIQTAQTIATAVNAALADEEAYDVAETLTLSQVYSATTTDSYYKFAKAIKEILGDNRPTPKYNKSTYVDFVIDIDIDDTTKEVRIGIGTRNSTSSDIATGSEIYPNIGDNYK